MAMRRCEDDKILSELYNRHVNVTLHSVKYPIYATQTNNNNRRHSILIDSWCSTSPSTLVIKIPSSIWINSACTEFSIITITTLRSSGGSVAEFLRSKTVYKKKFQLRSLKIPSVKESLKFQHNTAHPNTTHTHTHTHTHKYRVILSVLDPRN